MTDRTRIVGELPEGGSMRLRIEVDDKGKLEERTFVLPVTKGSLENGWSAQA